MIDFLPMRLSTQVLGLLAMMTKNSTMHLSASVAHWKLRTPAPLFFFGGHIKDGREPYELLSWHFYRFRFAPLSAYERGFNEQQKRSQRSCHPQSCGWCSDCIQLDEKLYREFNILRQIRRNRACLRAYKIRPSLHTISSSCLGLQRSDSRFPMSPKISR